MWEAHRRSDYFGRAPVDEKGDKPLHWLNGRPLPVDPAAIAAPVSDVLEAWWEWLPWVDVTTPFAGALEEWPARLTEGLAIARREWHSIGVWQRWRHLKRK